MLNSFETTNSWGIVCSYGCRMRDFESVSERFMETEKPLTKSLYSYHLPSNKLMPNRIVQPTNVILLPPQNLKILLKIPKGSTFPFTKTRITNFHLK
jgi:hypothetical protein